MNIVAVFCEDIREEVGGTHSLVGILPDNINLRTSGTNAPTDKLTSKLCIYARINFGLDDEEVGPGEIRLIFPNGSLKTVGALDQSLVDIARQNAITRGNVMAGLTVKMVLGGFQAGGAGQLRVEFVRPNRTYLAGGITFVPLAQSDDATSSGTEQPS